MKRYEVWLNGKLMNDYCRKGDALNYALKLSHKCNRDDDVLYVRDSDTDEIQDIL